MVMQSSQISGMVGGQMAMFSNSQAYSQQIAGLYGTGPSQQGGAGMQNPFPAGQAGAGMVSAGVGMAGGIMGAASVAGGFMGGAAGLADPFTGVGRSFMAGRAAMGGAGMMGMAGGMAAALPIAGAYAMGGAAISGAFSNIKAGAQNVADVGMIANAGMGPQFGQPGAKAGGGMGVTQIKQMTAVLEELASDDVMVTMDSLKRLMDKAGQSGALQGIGDAQQFKSKFGGMVKQLKTMAEAMGTSLEEAAPLFGQMQQMGMWKTSDIMGTATALKVAGPQGAQAMMGAMQQGASLSYAMGGRLGAGATQGREAFMDVQAASSSGVLSSEALREFTGGVGGVRGQQMMAQKMQGVVGQFGKTGMGRLMMAGLGEFKGGKFTGNIDEGAMEDFMAGDVSIGQLQSRGQKRSSSSREAATSFEVRQGAIGQEMMAQGGIGAIGEAMNQVIKRAGYEGAGENIQNMFLQKITGIDARTAEMIKKFGQNMPRLQEEKQRKLEAALDSQFQEIDRKLNRSWSGFTEAWDQSQENFWKPFRDLGGDMASSMERSLDRASDAITGRTKRFGMSGAGRQKMLRERGLGGQGSLSLTAGQASGLDSTSAAGRMRNLSGEAAPIGLLAGALGMSVGSNAELLSTLGAETFYGSTSPGEGWVEAGTTMPLIGQSQWVKEDDKSVVIKQAIARSEDRSWTGLGFKGDKTKEDRENLEIAERGMRGLFGNAKFSASWGDKSKGKALKFQTQDIMAYLKTSDPKAYEAMVKLSKRSGSNAGQNMSEMDVIALAAGETAANIDFDKAKERATGLGAITTSKAYDEAINQTLASASGELSIEDRVKKGAMIGGRVGSVAGPAGSAVGALLGSVGGALGLIGGADEELRSAFEEGVQNEDWGADAAKYFAGGQKRDDDNKFSRALARGDVRALAFNKEMRDSGKTDKEIGAALKTSQGYLEDKEVLKERGRLGRQTKGELKDLRAGRTGKKLGDESRKDMEELLTIYSGEDFKKGIGGAAKRAAALVEKLAGGDDTKSLSKTGNIGEFIRDVRLRSNKLGRLKDDASMEDIEKIAGKMPDDMRSQVEKMRTSAGGLDAGEKKIIQELYKGAVAKGGPGATREGRKDATTQLAETMAGLAKANTEFVFAVGAAVSGLKEKDVKKAAEAGNKAVESYTGKDPVAGS